MTTEALPIGDLVDELRDQFPGGMVPVDYLNKIHTAVYTACKRGVGRTTPPDDGAGEIADLATKLLVKITSSDMWTDEYGISLNRMLPHVKEALTQVAHSRFAAGKAEGVEMAAKLAESHSLGENIIREMMDARVREVQLWSVCSKRIAQAIRDLLKKE